MKKSFKNQNQSRPRSKAHPYLRILNRLLILFIVASGAYYIISVNDLSIKGFVINELKSEISRLQTDNAKYELRAMELESYEVINKRAIELKMVKVDKIDYIDIAGSVVAKK